MSQPTELRCRQCGELVGICREPLEPSTEAIFRTVPVTCFFCDSMQRRTEGRTDAWQPYRDE